MEDSYKNSHKGVKIVQNVQKLQLDKKKCQNMNMTQ